MTVSTEEVVSVCADAFVAAHSEVHEGSPLVYDTFERVVDNDTLVDDIWATIRAKYQAKEYPFGVFTLPSDATTRIRQIVVKHLTGHRYPELLDLFRKRLKAQAFA